MNVMNARNANVLEYGREVGNKTENTHYHHAPSSSSNVIAVDTFPYRRNERYSSSPSRMASGYEVHPYISSADVHVYPESITVSPGRKTITLARKEAPQYAGHQYAYPSSYKQAMEEQGDLSRQPERVYKTTMVTQVKSREADRGSNSPQPRSDSRLLRISVEPTQQQQQEIQLVRYPPSPDSGIRSFVSGVRQSPSSPDWPGQSGWSLDDGGSYSPSAQPATTWGNLVQTHHIQCSPDRTVEISFRHPGQQQQQQQFSPSAYEKQQPFSPPVYQQQLKQQPLSYDPQQFYPGQQQQSYFYQDQQRQSPNFYQDQQQQSPNFYQEDVSNEFAQQYRNSPDLQGSPLMQAVQGRVVYSPQPPHQTIAFSKRVEKKTPSHCSSIVVVPGGLKKQEQQQPDVQFRMTGGDKKVDKEAEVDELTNLLVQNMQMTKDPDFFGMCARCSRAIMGSSNGYQALGRLYHIDCFTCGVCNMSLKQKSFYTMEGVTFCEKCYYSNLEKCAECDQPITDKMLRAVGKHYHPDCFRCCVCQCCLNKTAFTLDANGHIYCLNDFNKKYAPRCAGCGEMIVPKEGKGEAERVVILDRNFHLECHRCEDCGKLLSPRFGGDGCFPLDDSILCGRCNAHRMEKLTNPASTSL